MQQNITEANVDLVLRCHMASQDHNIGRNIIKYKKMIIFNNNVLEIIS